MVTKYHPGLFSKMLAVEDDEMSHIGEFLYLYSTTKNLKGGIAACYKT